MHARPLVIAALLAGASCLGPCLGPVQAAPRAQVARSGDGAKITLYDSLCDEDNALECLIAEIGCDGPGDFTASVFDLNARDAAAVFAKANGKGSVSAGGGTWPLQVGKLALSPYTFNWDVTMTSMEKAREVWGAIWAADSVQLQVGVKKAVIRRGDVGESGFRDVVSTCGAESR